MSNQHAPTRWPGRPRPLSGESLSSWFARVAHANGLSPADLYSSILQGGRLNFIDLDRWCDPLVIQTLAERTHTPVDYVTQMGLSAYQGRVYERDDPNASLVWLPPIGGTKKKSFGQQACPLCLDQEKPYLRRTWRLSFVTACRTHGTHLIDRCESCGAPITPSKFKGAISFQGCVRCGSDLRRISVHTASETDLEIVGYRITWFRIFRHRRACPLSGLLLDSAASLSFSRRRRICTSSENARSVQTRLGHCPQLNSANHCSRSPSTPPTDTCDQDRGLFDVRLATSFY